MDESRRRGKGRLWLRSGIVWEKRGPRRRLRWEREREMCLRGGKGLASEGESSVVEL